MQSDQNENQNKYFANKSELHAEHAEMQDSIVTVDRKRVVIGMMTCVMVLGIISVGGTALIMRGNGIANVNHMIYLMFGCTLVFLFIAVALWIRARWVCVAVVDEGGIIASTLKQKHNFDWSELCGARTYSKIAKNAKHPTHQLLLMLDDGRSLEMPIELAQMNTLYEILSDVEWKKDSPGQRLGTMKSSTVIVLGLIAFVLGIWWDYQLVGQFNQGVLFKGNGKAVLLKIGLGIVGPFGGICSIVWGLYHLIARPILYSPGWLQNSE